MNETNPSEGTQFAGQIAVVTGGSRGIGRAVAEHLLERGARVYLTSLNPESVDAATRALAERFGEKVSGTAVDVRDPQAVEAYVSEVESDAGRIDCLVNNAGLGLFGAVDEIGSEAWRRVIGTNLDGAFYFLAAVAAGMRRRGDGWIINIASLASRNAFAGGAAYNASKFGLLGLSDAAMLDLRPHGVRVTAILPGSVDTDFRPPGGAARDTSWMLTADDVARAVVDLMSYPSRALPSRLELRPSRPPGAK